MTTLEILEIERTVLEDRDVYDAEYLSSHPQFAIDTVNEYRHYILDLIKYIKENGK